MPSVLYLVVGTRFAGCSCRPKRFGKTDPPNPESDMATPTKADVVTATRYTADLAIGAVEKAEAAVERAAELTEATTAAKRATNAIAATVPVVIEVAIATIFELPPLARTTEALGAIVGAAAKMVATTTQRAVEAAATTHVKAAVVEGNVIDTANAASSTSEKAVEAVDLALEAETEEATAALEVECPFCHNLSTDTGCLLCRGTGTVDGPTERWYRDNYETE